MIPRHTHRSRFPLLGAMLLISGAFLAPSWARADLASHFGMTPRTMGLGGAYVAVADDLASLYYNPAGLVQLQGLTVGVGFLYGTPLLKEGSTAVRMPDEISYHLHVGVPLSGRLKNYLALGAALNLPWGKHVETRLYQKQEPFFTLYDSSISLFQFRVGGALRVPWRPLSFLSFGAALQVLASMMGNVGFYAPFQRGDGGVPEDPDSRLEAWALMSVPTSTFFTLGAMADLGEHFRVGLTYRSAQYIEVTLPIIFTTRLAVSEDYKVNIPVAGTAFFRAKYYPQQVALGLSFSWKKILLSADLTWIDYSAYEPATPTVQLDIDNLKKDPGLAVLLGPNGLLLDPMRPEMQWSDRVVPRLGAEVHLLSWLTGRVGWFFERSPLESTDFPIYDCDKHGFAASVRASFLRPWDLVPGRLNLDLSLQELLYFGRSILGSEVGGNVLAISTGIEVVFL